MDSGCKRFAKLPLDWLFVSALLASFALSANAKEKAQQALPTVSVAQASNGIIEAFQKIASGRTETVSYRVALNLVDEAACWGRLESLDKAIQEKIKEKPTRGSLFLLMAAVGTHWPIAKKAKKIDSAWQHLREANPGSLLAIKALIVRHAMRQEWGEVETLALELKEKAGKNEKYEVLACDWLARAKIASGEKSSSLAEIDALRKCDPNNPLVLARAGALYVSARQTNKAQKCLVSAIREADGELSLQLQLLAGRTLLETEKKAEARRILAGVAGLKGEETEPFRARAEALLTDNPEKEGRRRRDFKPVIPILRPRNGAWIDERKPEIVWRVVCGGEITRENVALFIDGRDFTHLCYVSGKTTKLLGGVQLEDGCHTITAFVRDNGGRETRRTGCFFVDTSAPPKPVITYPVRGRKWDSTIHTEQLKGMCSGDAVGVVADCDSAATKGALQIPWFVQVGPMKEGKHLVKIRARDRAGNLSDPVKFVINYKKPVGQQPEVVFGKPRADDPKNRTFTFSGTVSRRVPVQVRTLFGQKVAADVSQKPNERGQYEWRANRVRLRWGVNIVEAVASVKGGPDGRDAIRCNLPALEFPREKHMLKPGQRVRGHQMVYFYIHGWQNVEMIAVDLVFPDGHIETLSNENFFIWNTRELRYGTPRFPNGRYILLFKVKYADTLQRYPLPVGR
ncbi:MAG: hypothetical protein KGZ25_15115 [Planctomycetes bacterium]|nr:hypothetical protein [Planctomycetota bacterium]